MIILEGQITNKVINGVRGDFSVGNFMTDVGQFKIRSVLLDQYEEGEYQVRVSVNKIDLNSYMSKRNGIIITEMELDIDHLEMLDGEIKAVIDEPTEPDASIDNDQPVDTEFKKARMVIGREGVKAIPVATQDGKANTPIDDTNQDMAELFGHLWPLAGVVKLDSTTPRTQFIRQKEHLKSTGYQFNGKDQTWHLS